MLTISQVTEDKGLIIKRCHEDLESFAEPKIATLREKAEDLNQAAHELTDKLGDILLTHHVLGRCRYCPSG